MNPLPLILTLLLVGGILTGCEKNPYNYDNCMRLAKSDWNMTNPDCSYEPSIPYSEGHCSCIDQICSKESCSYQFISKQFTIKKVSP